MRPQGRTVEEVLAGLAVSSHGVVTRAQLLGAGITVDELKQRVRSGALLREQRGVYRVGHRAPSTEACYLAAVWACGDGALLSGRAAAYLFGVLKGAPPPPEVTARTERRVAGVTTRRERGLDSTDATTWRAIPVTTVARTLVDLAADLSLDALARACHEAGVLHCVSPAQIEAVLQRRPRGAAASPDQPARRQPPSGLPLARASPHRRARQLSLPQLAARVGGGPSARARGARSRRRVPSLHLRRRD